MAGEVVAVPLADDHLALRFRTTADRDRALSGGPWVVAGQLLAMDPWKPDFVPGEDAVKTAVVWLRLPRLPPEYWAATTILRIAAMAGRPIALDGVTEQRRAMGFARVKVAIDATEPLLPGVQIQGKTRVRWQPFVYENVPDICFRCGRIGHLKVACRFPALEQTEEERFWQGPMSVETGNDPSTQEASPEEVARKPFYGPWLVATRIRPSRPAKGPPRPRKTTEAAPESSSARPLSSVARSSFPEPPLDTEGWQKSAKVAHQRSPSKVSTTEGNGDPGSGPPRGGSRVGSAFNPLVGRVDSAEGKGASEQIGLQGIPEVRIVDVGLGQYKKRPRSPVSPSWRSGAGR
ncbi:uncharacterized protein LOC120112320 isoform X1 [Phoenix dactylifera]|uniref:Uncharacterized protein LOC120112320 isoform X1 n=1 Tax=Phoenix dactylifera TaxID=42345 RepID=A0A8B9AKG0_PHODC|nr:uncharacterized protein LOC120112320 isoform X1 [Phoenix dactylifera]XP_038987211.1 uncharacterized protein LOC120112320 isoform X1 [Phoenix dactylifera]